MFHVQTGGGAAGYYNYGGDYGTAGSSGQGGAGNYKYGGGYVRDRTLLFRFQQPVSAVVAWMHATVIPFSSASYYHCTRSCMHACASPRYVTAYAYAYTAVIPRGQLWSHFPDAIIELVVSAGLISSLSLPYSLLVGCF